MTQHQADIGIFGGSGFYEFAEGDIREIKVETPYGPPSDAVALAAVAGHRVAFLPRHGRTHSLPPHRIPYRANLWALRSLGVTRILAPCAVGSLQAHIRPGHFVISDQFVDRTAGRADTFYDGPIATHVSSAEPYCPQLRALAIDATKAHGIPVHETGTCVVIQGPRFSTKAESRWFTQMGWDAINMTQYPEAILARELALCYVNIALVTDYDAGVVAPADAVQVQDVLAVLRQNNENVKKVIHAMLERMPPTRDCPCPDALKYARLE
ncbi:MAG: S-methyl-5'-thioadenosine phosphorylase [Armatimonadetes bacterium]|nr:S-methyl-5'-thioadenosine phosphorylase [Armatimonadota bacterium]